MFYLSAILYIQHQHQHQLNINSIPGHGKHQYPLSVRYSRPPSSSCFLFYYFILFSSFFYYYCFSSSSQITDNQTKHDTW